MLIRKDSYLNKDHQTAYKYEIWDCGSITTITDEKTINRIDKLFKESNRMNLGIEGTKSYVMYCLKKEGII